MTKCMKIDRCLDCKHFVSSDHYSYQSHCGKAKLPEWLKDAIEDKIAEIESDERYSYPAANVFANAPLALIQMGLKGKLDSLQWVLSLRRDKE